MQLIRQVVLAAAIMAAASSLAVLPDASANAASGSKWRAVSETASAITGDIRMANHRIYFANGKSIGYQSVNGARSGVYEISPRNNPVLLHGNTLCDHPHYVMFVFPDEKTLYLKVFEGKTAPEFSASMFQDGMCAEFNYERVD